MDEFLQDINLEVKDSLPKLADNLVVNTRKLLQHAKSEEDLRIGFEKFLEPIKNELNIKSTPKFEKTIYRGHADAVHGQVVIEYELPKSFSSKSKIDHAYNQLVDYLSGESKDSDINKLIGIGFDGEQIFFVQYKDKDSKTIDRKKFIIRGPYDFNSESARTFLIHLRALSRLPLTAENVSQKFGPQSELAQKAVSALVNAFEYWGDQTHIRTFYNEWKRLFGIVYGEQFSGPHKKEEETLLEIYKIREKIKFQELLFTIHTYFAILIKLIAAELLTLRETSFVSSLSSELAHDSYDILKKKIEDIENGGVYARKVITNFLEGDFFRWYIYTFESPQLKDAIKEIARALSEFEPATSFLDPASTRDLLKKLYQYLVPLEVRHNLGEYYTPDWLAELLLNEVGYDGNTLKRFLDPACGSGTFLVLAIQRAKKHGLKEKLPPLEIAKRIISNIWGFDLNPLAVIAARTNYLFALGDLANELQEIEIPIYLADSILWPRKDGQIELNLIGGEYAKVKTSVKEFHVPYVWIENEFFMKDAAEIIERDVKNNIEPEIAIKHLINKGVIFPPHEKVINNFYKEILDLEKENKNGIWARLLKNTFAPIIASKKKFDFVVGNPPWIRWRFLSKEYKEATFSLWKEYGLFSLKGYEARLGGGEKDFSMLFTYASADYYLRDGALLGFLITQEVFKSKGAGEGFRRFQLGEKQYLKVLKAHDFVSVQPFKGMVNKDIKGAVNKTAAIIIRKGEMTKYPIPYILWNKKKGIGSIPDDRLLAEVLPFLHKIKLIAKPMGKMTGAWQTIRVSQENSFISDSTSAYIAHQGAYTAYHGVYWLQVKQILANNNVLVENWITSKKDKIKEKVEMIIEPDLIFPMVRGKDLKRWGAIPKGYVLMVQDPVKREPYPELKMKQEWPRTYSYLTKFREELLNRGSKPVRQLAELTAFYAMFGIGTYTFSNYKVIWQRMTNDLIATVISQFKTPFGYKIIVPVETVTLISTNTESEAHYLCAIVNSRPIRDFIKTFASAGRGFGSTSLMEHIGILKFEPENKIHQKLVEISKKCHKYKSEDKEEEIIKLEKENDELVKKLYGIKAV